MAIVRLRAFLALTFVAASWANGGQAVRIAPSSAVGAEDRAKPFVHPGLLHSKADLERMKKLVAEGAQPWRSGFEALRAHSQSRSDWKLRGPFESVSRGPRESRHIDAFDADGNAAYQNALMWCVSGDEAHARKSVEILNAWSAKLREITGSDRELGASLGGFKFASAAEILRYTYPGWRQEDVRQCERMMQNVVYPAIKDFATFANGNWDTGCIKTMMAIGVFCDDRAIFDRAVDYFHHGSGNGRLTHYIINAEGQCQESGRDQQHAQLGLGHLADACEIGWTQGLDLYGTADDRLLKGFEYTARYNLGNEVPFVFHVDTTGKYAPKAISAQSRGRLRPIFEMVWNHYENRCGVPAPFTKKAAERLRPEGAAFAADHPGFGTLLFTQPPKPTPEAQWQWSAVIESVTSAETKGPPRAFLWIPPDCRRVRAVVVGQHNMEEEPILEHPRFRAAMGRLGVAAVWITPPLDLWFRFDRGAGKHFDALMAALARESGYQELALAPVVPIGHSAAASYPWNFAAWNPSRTLAAVSVSGQWPYWRNEAQPDWGARTIDGVPGIVTLGEYEAANERAGEGLKQRRQHPGVPLSMLAEPGAGHFDVSEAKVEYVALYLKKAMERRLPADAPLDRPVDLKPIDPTKDGWLVDRWRLNRPPRAPAAPVGKYTGDANEAFWCFDEEMARATEACGATYRGKQADLLGYVHRGTVVPQVNGTHQQVTLPFRPLEDGLTFRLRGTFLDVVPAGRPESWTGLKAGSSIEHAGDACPVAIDRICGPVEKRSDDTFAVRFYRMGMNNAKRSGEIWLMASHPGDERFKRAVQQAVMRIPLRNGKGADQHITFPAIADQRQDSGPIKLHGTSDAAMAVSYYVREGPAVIEGDTLKLTPIPPRAKFPVKVTVVAWQYGRSVEPLLKTADPVERTFRVTE